MDLGGRVALLVAVLTLAFGAWALIRASRGRLRPEQRSATLPQAWAQGGGSALTLVQVSSARCSACVHSARVWRAALADRPAVAFVEVRAEDHLDLVRELGILTTPTTLVYDGDGALRGRVTGAPSPAQATAALQHEPMGASR